MNGIARAQLLPKLRRLAAGLQRSPEKALLAAIVARAVCTIGVLKRNLKLGHEGTGGCGQDVTEDNGGSKGLHLHVGYHAEEIGQVAHENWSIMREMPSFSGERAAAAQERAPGVQEEDRDRRERGEGAFAPLPPARSEPYLNCFY